MFTSLTIAVTPFVLNAVMAGAKAVGVSSWGTNGKRLLLAVVSLAGVIAGSYLNGTPLDVVSVQGLVETILLGIGAFLAAHGSYTLFFK